jgi:hypothetical protein
MARQLWNSSEVILDCFNSELFHLLTTPVRSLIANDCHATLIIYIPHLNNPPFRSYQYFNLLLLLPCLQLIIYSRLVNSLN